MLSKSKSRPVCELRWANVVNWDCDICIAKWAKRNLKRNKLMPSSLVVNCPSRWSLYLSLALCLDHSNRETGRAMYNILACFGSNKWTGRRWSKESRQRGRKRRVGSARKTIMEKMEDLPTHTDEILLWANNLRLLTVSYPNWQLDQPDKSLGLKELTWKEMSV